MNKKVISFVASTLFACAVSVAQADLVYYLPFDNGDSPSLVNQGELGGTATASAGTGGSGNIPTASSNTAPGIGGSYSQQFTGSGSAAGIVTLPDSTAQFGLNSSSSSMTISTWVYWNGQLGSNQLYGVANKMVSSTNSGWGLSITNQGALRFEYGTGSSGNNRTSSNGVITAGQWMHIAVTWNAGSDHALNFYVNGVAAAPTTTFTGNSILGANGESVRLGVTTSTMYNSLNGNLDDYAMWNSMLSVGEIRALGTAPVVLGGYNALIMDKLFEVSSGEALSVVIDGLIWKGLSGIDVTGRALGDTWIEDDRYFIWLSGSGDAAQGVVGAAIPEPSMFAAAAGLAALALACIRRRR